MKNKWVFSRAAVLLLCLLLIGTLLPAAALAAPATPVLKDAVASGSGIKVTWNKVSGASDYVVYRKTEATKFTRIGFSTKASFKDETAEAGITYTYTVSARAGGQESGRDPIGVSAAWTKQTAGYISTPKLVSATGKNNGIEVKWKKVTGATGYRIFRKAEKEKTWSKLIDVGDVEKYLDKTAKQETKYTYTVCCLKKTAVKSDKDEAGVTASWKSDIAPGQIAAPKLDSVTAKGKGLEVTWHSVYGAFAYRVFRRLDGEVKWTKLVDVKSLEYLDNTAKSSYTYYYTVACLNSRGQVISKYNEPGIFGSWYSDTTGDYPAPRMKEAKMVAGGLEVTWESVDGASSYAVYRKIGNGAWAQIGTAAGTSYVDAPTTSGSWISYSARVLNAAGKPASDYNRTGTGMIYFAPPTLVSAVSTNGGISVSWKAVSNAPKYAVLRRNKGKWSLIGYTTETSFIDTQVAANKTYRYTVRVASEEGKPYLSMYNTTGVSGKYYGKAAITALTPKNGAMQIKWAAVKGADSYKVFRKTGEGEWRVIGSTTKKKTFDDTEVANNTEYIYLVRAYKAGVQVGTDDGDGIAVTFYDQPTLGTCSRISGGLRYVWEPVEGVSNYRVYRRIGDDGDWMMVGTSAVTSFSDLTPPSGILCYYTVACADAEGNAVSSYHNVGQGIYSYMETPVLTGAKCVDGGILFTWNPVDNQESETEPTYYRVYRRTGGKTSWDVMDFTTDVEYFDDGSNLTVGETYYYTVAVRDDADSENLSEYDTTGVNTTYYNKPSLNGISNTATGVKITWRAVDGIGNYRIYRKTGNSGWTAINTSTSASYTDADVVSNAHYWYTVSCLKNNLEVSAFDEEGISIIFYEAPDMIAAEVQDGAIKISWNPVDGIGDYAIYRRVGAGAFAYLDSVTDKQVTYTDDTVAENTAYAYVVACELDGNVVSATGSAVGATYMKKPVISKVSGSAGKVKITWKSVPGAVKYKVCRKTAVTSLREMGTVTDLSFTDVESTKASTYLYVVYAVAADGTVSTASNEYMYTVP